MKSFKTIDLFISILLIVCFTVICLVNWSDNDYFAYLVISYILIGTWQVISMIVHVVTKTFTYKVGSRYYYHWITFIAVITMPLGSYIILFFIAPFMAIIYTGICYHEVFIKMQRPLAQLK